MELSQATVKIWNAYTAQAKAEMDSRLDGRMPFLWIDADAARAPRLRQGEILVAPAHDKGTRGIRGGLIHHWIGAAFIPNATIKDVLAVVRDYPAYKKIYLPAVIDSGVLSQTEHEDHFYMRVSQKVMFVDAAVDGEYASEYFPVSANRWYSLIFSTRLQQVIDRGQPAERKLPPDQGDGFIWRGYSFTRYEQRDGGVYIEEEAMLLSRNVPAFWRWIVSPIVERLSRDAVTLSLRETRDAVRKRVTRE